MAHDQHGVDVLAVPPGQRAQRRLPGEHLLQPGRVGVQPGQVPGQLGGDVDQRHRGLLQLAGKLDQPGVGGGFQVVTGRLHQADGGGRVGKLLGSGQGGHRHLGRGPQPVDVLQPAGLGDQLDVLAGQRRDRGDLRQTQAAASCSRCARSRALARRSARSAASCCHWARSAR